MKEEPSEKDSSLLQSEGVSESTGSVSRGHEVRIRRGHEGSQGQTLLPIAHQDQSVRDRHKSNHDHTGSNWSKELIVESFFWGLLAAHFFLFFEVGMEEKWRGFLQLFPAIFFFFSFFFSLTFSLYFYQKMSTLGSQYV